MRRALTAAVLLAITSTAWAQGNDPNRARIRQLEAERDLLRRQVQQLQTEVAQLRERIAQLEAGSGTTTGGEPVAAVENDTAQGRPTASGIEAVPADLQVYIPFLRQAQQQAIAQLDQQIEQLEQERREVYTTVTKGTPSVDPATGQTVWTPVADKRPYIGKARELRQQLAACQAQREELTTWRRVGLPDVTTFDSGGVGRLPACRVLRVIDANNMLVQIAVSPHTQQTFWIQGIGTAGFVPCDTCTSELVFRVIGTRYYNIVAGRSTYVRMLEPVDIQPLIEYLRHNRTGEERTLDATP